MTMGTAMIVTVLATAALLTVRIQRGQIDDVADTTSARLYARAAIDMALFRIENDPDWRQKMKDGTWEVEQPIGDGTYSLQAIDPVDGDLTDEVYDPVVIVATGRSGPARHMLQVRLRVKQPGLRCLEPAIHGGNGVTFDDGVTANSDRIVSANATIKAKNAAQVFADVEAEQSVLALTGGVFHGSTTTEGQWPREMPDGVTVLDYYTANGTAIDIADLPLWDADQLVNSDMTDGTTSWQAVGGCSLTSDADGSDGSNAIRVDGRTAASDGPGQDVTDKIQSGETYYAKVDAKSLAGLLNLRITLTTESTGSGTQTVSAPWTEVGSSEFALVEGNLIPTWTGILTQARWLVESQTATTGFKVDATLLKIANATANSRAIHRRVLSPASNPFGVGNTNPKGLYIVNCGGQIISIKDCRILGTLVLIDPGNGSRVHGSMNWTPAVIGPDPSVPNLPALLATGSVTIACSSTGLDEGLVNANFNPPGIPYEASEDSEKDDIYPSVVKGVLYCTQSFTLEGHPAIEGVVVAQLNIQVNGTNLDVTYAPVYFEENAPPGFRADPVVEIVSGSFKQVVD